MMILSVQFKCFFQRDPLIQSRSGWPGDGSLVHCDREKRDDYRSFEPDLASGIVMTTWDLHHRSCVCTTQKVIMCVWPWKTKVRNVETKGLHGWRTFVSVFVLYATISNSTGIPRCSNGQSQECDNQQKRRGLGDRGHVAWLRTKVFCT